MSTILGKAVFYPTLFYNVVMEKISSRCWFNRIDDTVVLGALPFKKMIPQLVNGEDIRGVVTLTEDYEMPERFVPTFEDWKQAGVDQLKISTKDFVSSPNQSELRQGVEFILRFVDNGGSVYVHCKAGRSRSATLVGCYLMSQMKWTPEQAIGFIKHKRPHVVIRTAQWRELRTYYQDNITPKQ
ncbi:unnamed protein product [Owenia fusiformis]|uniref:Phosphatidylglycerophosphatase and protein-tyrosine phosphatase 1 n=1 Tax=Owenia fusiformis TaxID=6347 RepID=A0A8J1Y6K1_OWEFU|nr:unnamed protein product [Owenia fusiformis]